MPASSTRLQRQGALTDVFYLILRRMRFPLLLLIGIYAVCTLGLSLIPGVDAQGAPTEPMGMFNAFYVVSFTGTTIGLGEIPQAYSTAQRIWMLGTIYATVIGWFYSLVNILALLQESAFQNALRQARGTRKIYSIRESFYIVVGAGETGMLVCHGLDRLRLRFIVIERDEDRLARLRLEEFHQDPLLIAADASQPQVLSDAGLVSPHCRGVMALTDDDEKNQAVAVTTRLLAPRVAVLARIRNREAETHVGVFGGDLIVNPFQRFARQLAAAITAPERYRLRETLIGLEGEPMPEPHQPPRGKWIMCGYGRFGHAVVDELRGAGIDVTVIDVAHYDEGGVDVRGSGIDSESLLAAGVRRADGIVAGNASDTKNLAIAVTARDLNPSVFVVTRQNQTANAPLFNTFTDDLCMVPSHIVAQEFLARITTPLLGQYLKRISQYSERECKLLSDRLARYGRGRIPELWDVVLRRSSAEAVCEALGQGRTVTVGHLLTDPSSRGWRSEAVVLMVRRGGKTVDRPGPEYELAAGDRLLVAGSDRGRSDVEVVLRNPNVLSYVQTGQEGNGGVLWRRASRIVRGRH
ncbi:NAD-binding protein [uncultured Propionibacterium sp.]|uniref:potassium channel family protein n=1 Tax=uncultured Propionibacterium sp. TaxID=218066 RepID=UPI00292D773B|nr:NAD-binding protein [uncultured Propionibacterium sp.]